MNPELGARIIDALDDGVFTLDRDGKVTSWNRRMLALTGIHRDQIVGRSLFDIVQGWRLAELRHLGRALDGETAVASAFPLVTTGGHEVTYAPLDHRGRREGVLAIVRTAGLSRPPVIDSDPRFQVMAETAPVLLWMSGADGRCTFVNPAWLAFTGRTLDMEIGNGWADRVHPDDVQRCIDQYLTAFVSRVPYRMEYRMLRSDGEYRWLLDTGVPRYLASGAFVGFVGSCVDITDLKLARDALELDVRARTAALEAFAHAVSYELRPPLRSIEGFSRRLLDSHAAALDVVVQDYLHRVHAAARHMASMIDDLLYRSGRPASHSD
jgi:PAS domain S-box-containing protein